MSAVTVKQIDSKTYEFTANTTFYTVFVSEDGYEVWSKRQNMSCAPTIRHYPTLDMLAARSKALKNFSTLISA